MTGEQQSISQAVYAEQKRRYDLKRDEGDSMSYMSALDAAGITVKEMAAYLAEHLGVDFDEAVKAIENKRHTGIPLKGE